MFCTKCGTQFEKGDTIILYLFLEYHENCFKELDVIWSGDSTTPKEVKCE